MVLDSVSYLSLTVLSVTLLKFSRQVLAYFCGSRGYLVFSLFRAILICFVCVLPRSQPGKLSGFPKSSPALKYVVMLNLLSFSCGILRSQPRTSYIGLKNPFIQLLPFEFQLVGHEFLPEQECGLGSPSGPHGHQHDWGSVMSPTKAGQGCRSRLFTWPLMTSHGEGKGGRGRREERGGDGEVLRTCLLLWFV